MNNLDIFSNKNGMEANVTMCVYLLVYSIQHCQHCAEGHTLLNVNKAACFMFDVICEFANISGKKYIFRRCDLSALKDMI